MKAQNAETGIQNKIEKKISDIIKEVCELRKVNQKLLELQRRRKKKVLGRIAVVKKSIGLCFHH